MALEVTNLEREFHIKKSNGKLVPLSDPDPNMSLEDVMKFHAAAHPELTNGTVQGPVVVKDKAVYSITTKAGTLG